jgi:hypothetical protein
MKILAHPLLSLTLLVCSVCLFASACGSLKSEFLSSPTTNTLSGVVTPAVSNVPPIVPQLQEAAGVAGVVLPAPWGGIVQAGLLTLAGAASAFATFHARKAADASAAASAAGVSSAPVPPAA